MARRGERVGMRIGEEKERERRLWKERTWSRWGGGGESGRKSGHAPGRTTEGGESDMEVEERDTRLPNWNSNNIYIRSTQIKA